MSARQEAEIWCPQCEYRPRIEDRWQCTPSCGTVWHTFWTRGVCPGCTIKWPKTGCPACQVFSAHEAWYHYPEPDEGVHEAVVVEDDEVVPEAPR